MHTPTPINFELLDRYCAGEATPDEAAIVHRWVNASAGNRQFLDRLRAEFGVAARQDEPSDPDHVWARIAQRVALSEGQPSRRPIPFRRVPIDPTGAGDRRGRRPWVPLGVAAAAALVLAAVGASILQHRSRRPVPGSPVVPAREFVTTRGQRAEFRLSDGTMVVLAPASRLTVPARYDSAAREVTLEGEAHFGVVHNDRSPFVVRAGHATIRDLGTRFVIRALADEATVRVVVTEGEVELTSRRPRPVADGQGPAPTPPAQTLHAGDLGRIDSSGRTMVRRGVDTTRFTSWTAGILTFDRTPVGDVIAELSRWYDVDVRVADRSLVHRTVTAILRDQSLTEVLDLVAVSLGARIERDGRTVVLRDANARDPL